MTIKGIGILALLLSVPVWAQRQKLGTINTETPEGQLLQQIGSETDDAKKTALLEQFAEKYPKHDGAGWVFSQLVAAYTKAGQFDKALDADDKLLALDPEDLEMSYQGLKAAEGKKDPGQILKWSNRTSEIARRAAAKPKPADEDEVEAWKRSVDYAKQVDVYTEYALLNAALQTTDPKQRVELGEALEKRNPDSQYLLQMANARFLGYRQLGQNDKAAAVAEKVLEKDQTNDDMLIAASNSYLEKNQHPEKILAYSAKLLELMNSKPKPEGMSDADWAAKKSLSIGLAHWFTGVAYSNEGKWDAAQKALLEAMPLVKANDQLRAVALFHLGLSNYKQGKNAVARQYFQQCAAINSGLKQQALANLKAIPKAGQ